MRLTHDDRRTVKRLQKSLSGKWDPNKRCKVHIWSKRCKYKNDDGDTYLTKLHLCGMDLSQVPSEVWEFSFLQELFLEKNQLSTLPAELRKRTILSKIHLADNPLQTPPPEIIKQGLSAIREYLRTNRICPNCNNQVANDTEFCETCGASL